MLQAAASGTSPRTPSLVNEEAPFIARSIEALRWMVLARILDEKMAALYRAGKVPGGVFLGRGQEALSAAVGMSLRSGDIFAPLIRDTAGRLAFGEPVLDAVRTYLGSPLGPMRAREGNVHRGRPLEGLFPMISHLGAMVSVVNGALMARRFKGISNVVGATCLGDGGTSTGAFHEALNQAAVEKLPLVLIVADNQYAYSTPTSRQYACLSLVQRAPGYGIAGHEADGTNLTECLQKVGEAVRLAREGRGPQMVVARLLRLCGHGEHDDFSYLDPELKKSPVGRDCLQVSSDMLCQKGWVTPEQINGWRDAAQGEVDAAVATVQHEPQPDPACEDWRAYSSNALEGTL